MNTRKYNCLSAYFQHTRRLGLAAAGAVAAAVPVDQLPQAVPQQRVVVVRDRERAVLGRRRRAALLVVVADHRHDGGLVVGLRRALLLGHHQLLALLLEQLQLLLLVLVQEVQALEVLAALLLLLELVLVEQLRPGAARRPGLLEVRPPVVLDLVVRPPRQAPRDRRPPAPIDPQHG